MSGKSPFIIQKALIGIGGKPKSIKKLRSDSPLTVTPHRTLNSCRGVISESDLLCASETEILESLSDQGVTHVRRMKIKIVTVQPPSASTAFRDAKQISKARARKRKELLKKMKEAIIEIKMNPHRPRKRASDEYTTDEEEMIVYDVEDEVESNPDYVKKKIEGLITSYNYF
ncbi:uncharacterized protein TNCV_4328511 [Trichonephila clavipes]|nr:uncharacterized protein TNCV_4328511 [Trichonephila clavipes]